VGAAAYSELRTLRKTVIGEGHPAAGLTSEQVCGRRPRRRGDAPRNELQGGRQGGAEGRPEGGAAARPHYIGTEHLPLGVLFGGGQTAQALAALGVDAGTAERLLVIEVAEVQAAAEGLNGRDTLAGPSCPAPLTRPVPSSRWHRELLGCLISAGTRAAPQR